MYHLKNEHVGDDDSTDGDDDGNDGGQELMKPQRADSSSWQNVWFRHTALRFLKIWNDVQGLLVKYVLWASFSNLLEFDPEKER